MTERAARRSRPAAADVGDQTLRVSAIVERLLFDIARSGYGECPELEYLDRHSADAIAEAHRPYAAGRYRVETDFGDSCAGVAYFDAQGDGAVRVEVELEDRSLVCTPDGARTVPERRRWQIILVIDAGGDRVLEMRIRDGDADRSTEGLRIAAAGSDVTSRGSNGSP